MGYTVELPRSHVPSDRQELSATKYTGTLEAAHIASKHCFGIGSSSKLNSEAQDDPAVALPCVHISGPKEHAHTKLVHSVNDNTIHKTSKLNTSHVINRK